MINPATIKPRHHALDVRIGERAYITKSGKWGTIKDLPPARPVLGDFISVGPTWVTNGFCIWVDGEVEGACLYGRNQFEVYGE